MIHLTTCFWHRTEKYGEDALESADLYFAYGKALLENAISQASVLGKEQQEQDGEIAENKGMMLIFCRCPLHVLIKLQAQN